MHLTCGRLSSRPLSNMRVGAEPVGGLLAPNYREVTAVGWFGHDDLPSEVMWWYRTRILRALDGAVGEVWLQDVASPIVSLPRRDAYALRDTSNLSRRSFYETYLSQAGRETTNGSSRWPRQR